MVLNRQEEEEEEEEEAEEGIVDEFDGAADELIDDPHANIEEDAGAAVLIRRGRNELIDDLELEDVMTDDLNNLEALANIVENNDDLRAELMLADGHDNEDSDESNTVPVGGPPPPHPPPPPGIPEMIRGSFMLPSKEGNDPVDGLKVTTSFNNYVSSDGYSKNRDDKVILACQETTR